MFLVYHNSERYPAFPSWGLTNRNNGEGRLV
jgi:hypothetical protein